MSVWSLVDLKEVLIPARWDAEYWQPRFKELTRKLIEFGCEPLGNFASSITRGVGPSYSEEGTVAVIRTVNVRQLEFSTARQEKVTAAFFSENSHAQIRRGNIAITSTGIGTLGRTFCNLSDRDLIGDGHISILRLRDEKEAAWLTCVLQSRVGTWQLEQRQRGSSGQIEIYPEDVGSILVPTVDAGLKRAIASKWRRAVDLVESAERLYPEAEAELLERLEWEKLRRSPELAYVADFQVTNKDGRLDAEYYHPHYRRIRDQISKNGCMLSSLVYKLDKGAQPSFYEDQGDIVVIKSKQVTGRGLLLDECSRTSGDIWSDEQARLNTGDVVINSTGRGTLGRAAVIPVSAQRLLAAVDLVICRCDTSKVLPQYLSLFLNSPPGAAQSEQFQTGSSGQLHLYPQHFAEYMIFLPRRRNGEVDIQWQRSLAEKLDKADQAIVDARLAAKEALTSIEQQVAPKLFQNIK